MEILRVSSYLGKGNDRSVKSSLDVWTCKEKQWYHFRKWASNFGVAAIWISLSQKRTCEINGSTRNSKMQYNDWCCDHWFSNILSLGNPYSPVQLIYFCNVAPAATRFTKKKQKASFSTGPSSAATAPEPYYSKACLGNVYQHSLARSELRRHFLFKTM